MISFTYSEELLFFFKNMCLVYVFWLSAFFFYLCIIYIMFYLTLKLNFITISPKNQEKMEKEEEFSDSLDSLLYFLSFKYKVIYYL